MKGETTGTMIDGAYYHEGPNKSRAVVLLTDIFGLPLVNCKLLADRLSNELQCDVWVPDYFTGGPPFKVEELDPLVPHKAGDSIGFTRTLRFIALIFPRLHRLFANRASVVDPKIDSFIAKIRDDKKYDKVGAVGYCFGGSAGIRLGSRSLVDSLVIAHPGICTIEEIRAIKVPTAWVCAEDDSTFNAKIREEAERAFASRKDKPEFKDYEFKVYKGTAHGFAARPDLSLPEICEAYEQAFEQTKTWFAKTL